MGDVTGSASFDGTADITITAAVADDSHDHTIANVDGLQTALDGKLASTSTTDNITEGSSNLYYTDARANSAFDIRIATKDTDDLSEGSTNLYYTNARFDTQLATKDTGDLTEGTNLYYTDARVLTKINATSIDALNDVDTTTATPSDGQVLTWDNTAGYWKPSTVSGGGGGGSGDITSVVAGSGLTGGASTGDATLNVGAGSFITVAADTVAVDATDANTASKVVARDASGNFSASTITASLTGNVTGTVSDVSNHDTDDITEGSTNLYYTDARFNTAFSGKSTSDLSEGANLYYTNARADARVAAATGVNLDLTNQDTDDLSEGSTNLYYTDTRANAAIDARVDEDFINALNVDAASADTLTFTVKNSTGATLEKGSVVYVSGLNGNTPEVSLARANSSSTMPAFGLVGADIANTADGTVDTFGSLTGLDVADFGETGITFSLGDTVYVSSSEAGKLTNVAPSGEANLIQNIGKIERATPTNNMTIKVGGAGRTNATPNLNDGNIFIGDSNNKAVTSGLDSEVRSRVSANDDGGDGAFSYDSGTGVFTYTGPSASEVRAHLSASFSGGDGAFSYDSSNGVFTHTGPSAAETRAHFTGGTGVTITNGEVAIGQAVGTSSNVTFNNVVVSNGLTVQGSTTTVDTTNLAVTDSLIELSSGLTTGALNDAGLIIERGTSGDNAFIGWDESEDKFTLGTTSATGVSVGSLTVTTGTLVADIEGAVTGTVSSISNHDTDDLPEGSTNLYYTNGRADDRVNLQTGANLDLSSKSTTNLGEGSNLYYTDARVDGHLNQSNPTDGYVLSWTNNDYAWVAQSGPGTFANLTDTSVGSQASNTLIKYNGSAYVPTSLSEDSSGNVTSLVAGDSGNVSVDIRKANVRTTTGTVDLVGGASLYNAGSAATYSCANLNEGDIVTVYAAAASVAVVPGASTSLFKDGNDITGTSETSVAIGQHTIATITMISDTVAIITGSAI